MAVCDTCGNDYHASFEVIRAGNSYTFDSIECAAHKIAPTCVKCGVRVLGHGVEEEKGVIFCCEHCLQHAD